MSASKSPVWTQEKADAAATEQRYIKLGDKRGYLQLSGAVQKWKSDPTFTYIPDLRVAGTPADIVTALMSLGYTRAQALVVVNSGFNLETVEEDLAAAFAAELATLKAFKASNKGAKKVVSAPSHSIAWYAQKVDEAKVLGAKAKSPKAKKAKKAAKSKSPKKAAKKTTKKAKSAKSSPKAKKAKSAKSKSPKGSPTGRKTVDLSVKVGRLAEGKVMDVTNYRADGSGASVIAAPSGKSRKVVVGQIAANPDALVGVKAAAKALGDERLVESWKAAREAAKVAVKAAKTSPKPKAKTARKTKSKASPASPLPMSPSSPRSPRALPVASGSPRGGAGLPRVRVPTIGSPRTSPRL